MSDMDGVQPVTVTIMRGRTVQTRDLRMLFTREGADPVAVLHMFDNIGSETHDPIEAVEVDVGTGELVILEAGDQIDMCVEVL
jgi:hypothetical protein